MLYGILSVALSNLHAPTSSSSSLLERNVDSLKTSKNGAHSKKTKILIGLPLSLRPFLESPSTRLTDSPPSSATDMAIRIGFGNLILDVLPCPAVARAAGATAESLRFASRDIALATPIVANARLAKLQFNEMFAAPGSTAAASRVSKLSIYLAKLYWSHYGKISYVSSLQHFFVWIDSLTFDWRDRNALGLPANNAVRPDADATPTPMSIGASSLSFSRFFTFSPCCPLASHFVLAELWYRFG